jgi:4-carboxymuconolactone decarboxylase
VNVPFTLLGDGPKSEILEAALARFDGDPPALYRALAHAPNLLEPYSVLASALRFDALAPRALRELLILRIALLTRSEYEWTQHRRMGREAGLDDELVLALREWRSSSCFEPTQRAALALADAFHGGVVSDETMTELRGLVSDQEVVELLMCLGLYEGLARVIQALSLSVDSGHEEFRGFA